MSSSSTYSSPSTSSLGMQANLDIKSSIDNLSHHRSRSIQPSQSNPRYSTARRRLGLPYSTTSHPTTVSLLQPTSSAPSSTPSRSLITVLPPESLASKPAPRRSNPSSVSNGSSSHFRKGTLIPLYPTLTAQLAAIAREYGLPCTGGMVLYLVEGSSRTGELANQLVDGPRISEEAWQILWSGVFEDEQQEAFENDLQSKELYYDQDPHSLSHLTNHQTYYSGVGQPVEEEEVLHVGLEELINSGLDFPVPPPNYRSVHPTHASPSSQEDSSSNLTTLSTEPSPISSRSSGRSDDSSKLHYPNNDRDSSVLTQNAHTRSQSLLSNQLNSTNLPRLHSTDVPSRPSTALSAQLSRRCSLARPQSRSHYHPASSDHGSLQSFSARPRRIGAGTIVAKIEFEIDRTRTSARWYDQWLNPSSFNYKNPATSHSSSDDHSRPLLLPNVITQRKKSSISLQGGSTPPPTSSNITPSPPMNNLNSSTSSQDKFHSFLAFDDNSFPSDPQSAFPSPNAGHIFYSNKDSPNKEASFPRGSPTNHLNRQTSEIDSKRQFGGRNADEQHRQAMDVITAQAHHQALVDQIDAQLFSSVDTDFSQSHSYGLSLGVDSHLELANIRYTQNHDDVECTFFSSLSIDPTTANPPPNQVSQVQLPLNKSLLAPEVASMRRNSSMDMKSDLDQLEQVLASLSPKALSYNPLPPLNPISRHETETRTSSLAWSKRTSGTPPRQSSERSSISQEEKTGGRGFKLFESLQGSFHDLKHRSSQQEIPVGLTEGYSREDVREHKAPLSPAVAKSSFNPALKSKIRPNTPTTKKSGDRFVSKAAGMMSGKFRNSLTK